jgi:hypothetical protein
MAQFDGILTYQYHTPQVYTWTATEDTPGGTSGANTNCFRKEIDWGPNGGNYSNRIGIYLIADHENDFKIRFFFENRTTGLGDAAGAHTGSVALDEPIIEEVDNNNLARKLFYVGDETKIYAEPEVWQGTSGSELDLRLTVYQVTAKPIKNFGL